MRVLSFNVYVCIALMIAYKADAQSMDTTIQNLVKNDLIKENEIKDFENLVKKSKSESNAAYMYALWQSEYKKIAGYYYAPPAPYISFGNEKPKETQQKRINQQLSEYLLKLKNSYLINEKVFDAFNKRITNDEFLHAIMLIAGITEQYAKAEYMNPDKLKGFAEKLKSIEVVTSEYNKLLTDIDSGKIENPIEFLNYCNKATLIKDADYAEEPEKYLEAIHKRTAALMPELAFTDFKFEITVDSSISDKESVFYNFITSLNCNGKKYKQKSYYRLHDTIKDQYFGGKIDQQEYYKIFNKILADQQSPYRLHEVKSLEGNAVDWKVFGIIALTKDQAEVLQDGGSYISPGYESFKNKLTSKKIDEAIEEYKRIGLLSHLTDAQIELAKEKVAEQENNNLNNVLIAFPAVIHYFDYELANLEDPYAELLREFALISHNDFNPTDISDNFEDNKGNIVTVKFKIGNTPYKRELKIESDWADPEFFGFVKSVATENKLKGQFYELYSDDQGNGFIYLTKEQYDYLHDHKLLVFGDFDEEEE